MSDERKDCCEAWPVFAARFEWMRYAEEVDSGRRLMPHVGYAGCGAEVRAVEMRAEDLRS